MIRRAVLVVMDGAGAGEAPDAAAYGDTGAATVRHVLERAPALRLPHLEAMGLLRVAGVPARSGSPAVGASGKMSPRSAGKDTVTGHWEMCGVVLDRPFPTYPHGFPAALIAEFERRIGTKTLGNFAASETQILSDLGAEHVRTGFPIVYTSADSVFQIACHEAVVPVARLYEWCAIARALLDGDHRVGRVIARPFAGETGAHRRTECRRDFAVPPPHPTLLDAIDSTGREVWAVGKIEDIFSRKGITKSWHAPNNNDALAQTLSALAVMPEGLLFVNLGDFDMLYGHRNDAEGFAGALAALDAVIPALRGGLKAGDLLILTADHGNDPTTASTDHNREFAPLLIAGPEVRAGVDLGLRDGFSDLGATLAGGFELPPLPNGRSFLPLLS